MLLPFEADICNILDLTEDEYWHFVALTEEYNGKRPEGYELIPEVRNDPVTIITLVVGIAVAAISALMAPKPQQPQQQKQRANLQTENITGKQRFTPTNNFDSVQEVAKLGEVIPLVYTRRGLRVSSQLLWSQLQSYGTGQQLSAIMLFSHGPLGAAPDFAGFAIGDTLLENYTNAKLKVYWRPNGGRLCSATLIRKARWIRADETISSRLSTTEPVSTSRCLAARVRQRRKRSSDFLIPCQVG